MERTWRRHIVVGADRDFNLQTEVTRGLGQSVAQRQLGCCVGAGEVDQDAEDQPTAQDDLFGVDHHEREPSELGEQSRRHTGSVTSGQRDEERALETHLRSDSTALAGREVGRVNSGTLYATMAASRTACDSPRNTSPRT